jgi:hypothetical protein
MLNKCSKKVGGAEVVPDVGINNDVVLNANAEQVASFLKPAGGVGILLLGGISTEFKRQRTFNYLSDKLILLHQPYQIKSCHTCIPIIPVPCPFDRYVEVTSRLLCLDPLLSQHLHYIFR